MMLARSAEDGLYILLQLFHVIKHLEESERERVSIILNVYSA